MFVRRFDVFVDETGNYLIPNPCTGLLMAIFQYSFVDSIVEEDVELELVLVGYLEFGPMECAVLDQLLSSLLERGPYWCWEMLLVRFQLLYSRSALAWI